MTTKPHQPTPEELGFFDVNGYLVLEEFLDPDHVDRLTRSLDQTVQRRRRLHDENQPHSGKTLVDANKDSWSGWAEDERWQWIPSRSEYAAHYDRHFWDVGFSLYGVVGLDLAVNLIESPLELADFLAGVITLGFYDPAGDDHRWEGPKLLDTVAAQ